MFRGRRCCGNKRRWRRSGTFSGGQSHFGAQLDANARLHERIQSWNEIDEFGHGVASMPRLAWVGGSPRADQT